MKKLIWICLLTLAADANAATTKQDSTFGFVDLLYWQVRESGAENWAQTFNRTSSDSLVQTALIDAPFDWNTGVRLGVGRQFSQYDLDLTLAYTHYQAYANNQASGTVASAFDGAYFIDNLNGVNLGITYENASIRWQVFYNTVDLNLGRHFTMDPLLEFHPYLGLKAATINQRIYTNWNTPNIPTTFTSATEDLKNDFSGIGPMIGVDSTWAIYTGAHQSVSMVGNIAAGLLAGHWNFNEVYNTNTGTRITVYVNSVNGVSPVATGLLGLQWNNSFSNTDMHVRLGYEAQLWYNQEQFYSLSMGRANRPISIQGADLEFGFSF